MIPSVYALFLLAIAAWRTFHLLAFDDILDPLRNIVVGIPSDTKKEDPAPKSLRKGVADFIECPFCLGFWIAGLWWLAWYVWPHGTLVVSVPFVLSAGVVAAQKYLTD